MADPEHIFEFELETVQLSDNPTVDEIPFPDEYQNLQDNSIENNSDTQSMSSIDSDNEEYYTISSDSEDEQLPTYSITNKQMTNLECWDTTGRNEILIDKESWDNNIIIDQQDELSNWKSEILDSGPSTGPFYSNSYTTVDNPHKKPEVYFNSLFDERMWTIIAESTNVYARSKRVTPTGNRCTDPTHDQYKKHCRLNTWTDVTPGDIKLFMAHILIMGLVNKSEVESYWRMNTNTKIPFFGKYMSRNRFQAILWNLHVNDDSDNPPRSQPGHDPLCKIRPFVDMIDRNFRYVYKPKRELSFDEACCPFKGRLRFRVYNPMKPNRFHIKLFQISEASSGYILGFHVYTGKDTACVSNFSKPLDPETTKTTKIVLGLLETTNLLDKGHHIYMDNYYCSPELFYELYYRETYACGTARLLRKGMPKTVAKTKLKPLESVFMRSGPLLCLKWCGPKTKSKKKPVTILSTIHEANEVLTKKKDPRGTRIPKPLPIYQYTLNMAGVDISDQYMAFHIALRKSMKWSRKLFFHMFNMLILNAYLLNAKYGKKMTKQEFIEYIANYLVETGARNASLLPQRATFNTPSDLRLVERHFPSKTDKKHGVLCRACNFTPRELSRTGFPCVNMKRRTTSYYCKQCNIPLCVTPCFELYHTLQDYKEATLRFRLPNQ